MKKANTPKENLDLCRGCTMCCEYITVIIETPKTEAQKDRIRWYLLHNVSVFVTETGVWKVHVPVKCTALSNKGHCSRYSTRPQLCRDHSQAECERYDRSGVVLPVFNSVEEFDEYLASQGQRKK